MTSKALVHQYASIHTGMTKTMVLRIVIYMTMLYISYYNINLINTLINFKSTNDEIKSSGVPVCQYNKDSDIYKAMSHTIFNFK